MRTLLRNRTVHRVVAVATTATALLAAVAAPAAAAPVTGTVRTGGGTLNVRAAASTSATVVRAVADGTAVAIDCQTTGTNVAGELGTTTLWDYVPALGGYISDAYVDTGSDQQVAPTCGVGTGSGQCSPGACAGEALFRSTDARMTVRDRVGDGHSAVVQYWPQGGAGPLQVWNPNGNGTTVNQVLNLPPGSWVFYQVCLGEHGPKTIVAGSCSAGFTDYVAGG